MIPVRPSFAAVRYADVTLYLFYTNPPLMQASLRQIFNQQFTAEAYETYMHQIENIHPGALDFRNAETPIFVPRAFTQQMLDACEDIIDILIKPDFKARTERAIPETYRLPGENDHPEFIAFDFGVCENEQGELEPQLIEMQAFPTLFAFQVFHTEITRKYANIPHTHDAYLNGYNEKTYLDLLKSLILGEHQADEVILLEIYPHQQKTRIDFYCTEDLLGIRTVCLTELQGEGDQLFYVVDGERKPVKRIYNRVIFDDLAQQQNLPPIVDLKHPWKVEWAPHPNWFYRISKFTLPFINNKHVPETRFLHELTSIPTDLENYVLKPLFSFAGMGVVIDVTPDDIAAVKDPENWILQCKVKYADAIQTPDIPAKAEIRLFYFWKPEWERPVAVHNLSRLSKGKMIGTRYNKDKTWVGGSVAFFEK